MNDFLKHYFSLKPQPSPKTFLTDKRTVCVKTKDGRVVEHKDITDPWKYIAAVKKKFNVDSVWIKEE
jgi:hypothetical protein